MKRQVTVEVDEHEYVAVMSDQFAGQYRVWSEPVQLMVEPSRIGDLSVVDVTLRVYECPLPHVD